MRQLQSTKTRDPHPIYEMWSKQLWDPVRATIGYHPGSDMELDHTEPYEFYHQLYTQIAQSYE
jgi:hypothetical protein